MVRVGERVVMSVKGHNAYRGRRSHKNRVSIPVGTVGVVVGHTRVSANLRAKVLRVKFPHDDVTHTVAVGFCRVTKLWPGQLWMSEDGEAQLVLEFSHFPRDRIIYSTEDEISVWWCLRGEHRIRASSTTILRWKEVTDEGG